MASIASDPKGNRTIQFLAGDGKRRSIRLGKLPLKDVKAIKGRVESLNGAAIAGTGWDPDLAIWVGRLDSRLYDKLAAAGLVPARAEGQRNTLGNWLDSYIALRSDVKPSTATVYGHTRRCLIDYFGANKPLSEITPFDADTWRIWLAQVEKLSDNTVKRRCGIAKQFFRAAQRQKLIVDSPFADMKGIATQRNRERFYFVSRAEAQKVLDACPDIQWQLLFALSRYGGLRCPSEHLALRWRDIDWTRGHITVHSPKTEHHEGKEHREIPIFSDLRPYLEAAWEDAKPGTEFVITRYREPNANLRTQLVRILAKARIKPWPKLFQNLRSTRQTELAEEFPTHVVCAWIGNSEDVAREHYLQVTDAHFEKAIGVKSSVVNSALQNPVQSGAVWRRNASRPILPDSVFSGESVAMQLGADQTMGGTGLAHPVIFPKEMQNRKGSAPLAPQIRLSHRLATSRNWLHLRPN